MKKTIFSAAVISTMFALGACSQEATTVSNVPSSSTTATTTPLVPKPLTWGESATASSGEKITVAKPRVVEQHTCSSPETCGKDTSLWLVVDTVFTNTTSQPVSVDSYNVAVSGEGKRYGYSGLATFTPDGNSSKLTHSELDFDGFLQPGESLTWTQAVEEVAKFSGKSLDVKVNTMVGIEAKPILFSGPVSKP